MDKGQTVYTYDVLVGSEDVTFASEFFISEECSVKFITFCQSNMNIWHSMDVDPTSLEIVELEFVPGDPPDNYVGNMDVLFGDWYGYTALNKRMCVARMLLSRCLAHAFCAVHKAEDKQVREP